LVIRSTQNPRSFVMKINSSDVIQVTC
jgi:hypothetical protein